MDIFILIMGCLGSWPGEKYEKFCNFLLYREDQFYNLDDSFFLKF